MDDVSRSARSRPLVSRLAEAGGLVGTRIYSQATQFTLFVFAARVLDVAAFGVFSIVFACAMGLSLVAEGGWREYIICHDDERLIGRSYGLATMISGVICLLGLSIALLAGTVADNAPMALTIAAIAALIPLRSLCTLHSGRLTKDNRIHQQSFAVFASESAGLLAGVLALVGGWGIVALGVSKLALQAVALIVLAWRQQPTGVIWRRLPEDRAMFAFALQIVVSRLSGFLRTNISVFVIGFCLSALAVGYYRAATRISGAASEAFREPARVIFWPAIRDAGVRATDRDAARVLKAESLGLQLVCVAAPVLLLLGLTAEPLLMFLLGPKWLPAAPVVMILALSYLIGYVSSLSEPLFSLAGKPKLARNLALISCAATCLGVLSTAPFGLRAVAWGELGASIVVAGLTLHALHRRLGFPVRRFLAALLIPLIALLGIAMFVRWLSRTEEVAAWSSIEQVAALSLSGAAIYVVLIGTLTMVRRRARLKNATLLSRIRTAS